MDSERLFVCPDCKGKNFEVWVHGKYTKSFEVVCQEDDCGQAVFLTEP